MDEFFASFRLSFYEDISERILLFLYSFLWASVFRLLCFVSLHLISVNSAVSEVDDEGPECPLPISARAEAPPPPLPALSKVAVTTVGTEPAGLRVVHAQGLVWYCTWQAVRRCGSKEFVIGH